jgi:hypothetical protein
MDTFDSTHDRSAYDLGLCKVCKWWQAEHDGPIAEDVAVGLCVNPELIHFGLQVAGHSSCNRFRPSSESGDDNAYSNQETAVAR